jgi:hypothetical protein
VDSLLPLLVIPFFILWLVRRRKKRREEILTNKLVKRPYTTIQIFGIIGILVFIVPIFWAVGVMLQKGLLLLFILFFSWIRLPIIITILKEILVASTLFLLIAGVYLVCEFIWPNRYVAGIKSIDSESAHPKINKT